MNQLMEQTNAARSLIESVHAEGKSLVGEYPLVFEEGHAGRVLHFGKDDEVDSACTLILRYFVMDDARVRGGLIGSVTTRPEKRGAGLGTRLLDLAERELREQGCIFALLWADDPSFYCKRGYAPMGGEVDFLLTPGTSALLPASAGVRALREGDAAEIQRVYAQHVVRLERSVEETRALLGCPGMRTLVLERDGEVVAYACLGRGRDLQGAIHEWGGATRDVLALIRAHAEEVGGEGLIVMAPQAATELCYKLTTFGAISKRGVLGLGKILDRERAATLLAERLGNDAEVDVHENGVHLRGPGDEGDLNDEALLALLFSAPEALDAVENLLKRFKFKQARLPLEPFAWGLDSI